MAKKQETSFKERVTEDLKSLGPCCYFVKIQSVAKRGIPDFFLCIKGNFIALELKKSRLAHVDKLQEWTIQKIAIAQGNVWITYPENWASVFSKLKEFCETEMDSLEIVEVH